ncbi:MAG: uracil-DNA glycosylase [Christensenellales bacterium]|jgi:uracil-DNA glycosylase
MIKIAKKWFKLLKDEFEKPYFKELQTFLNFEYQTKNIFPKVEDIFNALNFVSYDDVKVVIFGQDPYHGQGQAHGLSFSVQGNQPLPPSLKNIFKEIEIQFGVKCLNSGDLTRWARQGVLLLNTTLTVEEGRAYSHKDKGWEKFTQRIVEVLNQREKPIIFVLWGNGALKHEKFINTTKHFVLKSAHPSPLSAYNGFFGNGHFLKINQILQETGQQEIDWR